MWPVNVTWFTFNSHYEWLLQCWPMFVDPQHSQHHAGLQRVVFWLQQVVTRPKIASPVLPMLNLSQWLIHWEFCVFFKWANPGLFLFIFVLFKHKKSSIWWQQFNLPVLIDDVIFYLCLFRKATSSSSSSYLRFFAFYCVCIDIKFYWIVVRTQALSI